MMKFHKRSPRKHAKVSLILLDWSVRESFHLLHYLRQQTVPRDDFEVIIIEYYARRYDGIDAYADQVDLWLQLDMPRTCYYHKHLMYNVGITLASSPVVMIGDSDAMVRPNFIDTIIRHFEREPDSVYHMDQFRNMRRDLYPFRFPPFEEVLGPGCINNVDGRTAGVLNEEDPLHTRNYGACMCARRDHLIAIGGADEHIDYLGHICGPYDMTFRLLNHGHREVWEMDEFLYHTWHPGQAGADNYLGPHDGRHMSSTSLEALDTGRIAPLLENAAIRMLRTGQAHSFDDVAAHLIDPKFQQEWDVDWIAANGALKRWNDYKRPMGNHHGFQLVAEVDRVLAYPLSDKEALSRDGQGLGAPFEGHDIEETKARIDAATPPALRRLMTLFALADHLAFDVLSKLERRLNRSVHLLPPALKMSLFAVGGLAYAIAAAARLPRALRAALAASRAEREQLVSLAMTIHNLTHYAPHPLRGEELTLLLERDNPRRALQWAQRLGLIPAARFAILPSEEAMAIASLLDAFEADDSARHFIVPTAFYHRHHAQISAHNAMKRMILIWGLTEQPS
ncbi:glycosyltransferase family 2 protein [Magnetofaba australis]|uniref:Uncharacterized protein n=1 Tax=Magnetofaba australis IT-1 TaxID=1434232 RepID=A0A1Y2K1T2_9PROT|nr:glycosyltransferase family 2 protein [Magnetofaba australis]OSM01909.1 hypothetical protein MAIT1_01974 [Magnetofaba australis IT-1]